MYDVRRMVKITDIHTPGVADLLITLSGGEVAAGFPSPADDYIENPLDLNDFVTRHPASTFFVRVEGVSMINGGIKDRDILVVDRVLEAHTGHVVVAVINGEMVVKRLQCRNGKWHLVPENSSYKPVEITEDLDCVIWGVVTHVLHTLVS